MKQQDHQSKYPSLNDEYLITRTRALLQQASYIVHGMLNQNMVQDNRNNLITFSIQALIFALVVVLINYSIQQLWGSDFPHYMAAARTLLAGFDPYLRFIPDPSAPPPIGTQFVNPPWVAFLFIPFAILPYYTALTAWILTNGLILAGCMFLLIKITSLDISGWKASLIPLAFLPFVVRTFQQGQLTLLVTLSGLLAWWLVRKNKTYIAGFALSFTIIKIFPIIGTCAALISACWIKKHRTFPITFGGVSVLVVIVTTVIWPSWWQTYPKVDFSETLGTSLPGNIYEGWPVATLPDFLRYVVGLQLSTYTILFLQIGLAIFSIGVGYLSWTSAKSGYCGQQLVLATWSIIPLVTLPYVRSYDHAIIAFWLTGFFTDPSVRRSPSWVSIIGLVSYLAALVVRLVFHFEPWNFWVPASMMIGTTVGLVIIRASKIREKGVSKLVYSSIK